MSGNEVQEQASSVIHMSIEVALVAVYIYDWVLCLRKEIDLMWLGRFRIATMLYFTARYLPVAKLLFVVAVGSKNPPHCNAVYWFVEVLGVVARAAIIATLIGRTYAICAQKKIIILIPGTLGVTAVVLGFYEVFQTFCISGPLRFGGSSRWGIIISSTRLALEATGICLLVFKSHADFRLQDAVHHLTRRSFASFIFRTGVLYFVATFCLEMIAIIFNAKWSLIPEWLNGITNALPLPIPAILVSRFLLDLRQMASSDIRTPEQTIMSFAVSFGDIHDNIMEDFGEMTTRQMTTYVDDFALTESGGRSTDVEEEFEMTHSPKNKDINC